MKYMLSVVCAIVTINAAAQLPLWSANSPHINNTNSGNVGIGTPSPSIWFPGKALEIYSSRPTLKLNSSTSTSLSTILFTNSAVSNVTHAGEFHMNYSFNQSSAENSSIRFHSPATPGYLMTLLANGNVGIGVAQPETRLTIQSTPSAQGVVITNCDIVGNQSHLAFTTANQPRLGIGPESFLNTYNDGKWNFNSGNTSGTTLPISLNTNHVSRIFIKPDGNVGVGTETPAYKLDVNGSVNATAVLVSNNMGIGTVSPFADARLHIKAPSGSTWGIIAEANANQKVIGLSHDGTAGFISTGTVGTEGTSPMHFQTSGTVRMSILDNGNVSIGTPLASNPNNYLLAVNGKIGAKEVRVEKTSAAWPDYVFEPGYKLPGLKAVETYIQKNGHLEDVPTANDVETNGIDVGEMNAILLKKVEELTLYVIELKKENERQNKESERQNKLIEQLQKKN